MWGNIAAIFIIVGLLSKNISLLRDMKYMGGFYWHLPGIQKHFVVVRISFLRDFVIAGFNCLHVDAVPDCILDSPRRDRDR